MKPPCEPLRVYVVDDDVSVLDSLRALLSAHGLQPKPFVSAEAFLEAFDPSVEACLLLDLRMPGMGGIELQRKLHNDHPRLPVIILTGHGDIPVAVQAMKEGAVDFIEKPGSEQQLLSAIGQARDMLANNPPPAIAPEIVAERLARLTARERDVLDLLVLGMTNKSIADELGISQRTVEIHRARIREKLEARGLADLIRLLR